MKYLRESSLPLLIRASGCLLVPPWLDRFRLHALGFCYYVPGVEGCVCCLE